MLAQRRRDSTRPSLSTSTRPRPTRRCALARSPSVEARQCGEPLLKGLHSLNGYSTRCSSRPVVITTRISPSPANTSRKRDGATCALFVYGVLVASAKTAPACRLALVTTSCHGDPDPRRIPKTVSTSFLQSQPRDFARNCAKCPVPGPAIRPSRRSRPRDPRWTKNQRSVIADAMDLQMPRRSVSGEPLATRFGRCADSAADAHIAELNRALVSFFFVFPVRRPLATRLSEP